MIAFDASEDVDECIAKAFCPVERYGFKESSEWRVENVTFHPEETRWTVLRSGEPWGEFVFSLAGEYNVLNATAAAAMAATYNIAAEKIAEALSTFKSVRRRLEVKAEANGITIIDDFAHHPTAIAETLKALRTRYQGRRLWAVLEPRSNTLRRNVFAAELVRSLSVADEVVIASVFKAEAIPENERLSVSTVLSKLKKSGKPARECRDAETIVESITPDLRPGDVVAILSNGGFGGIYEKLPQKILALEGAPSKA